VVQAAGRVIRTQEDKGVVYLIDDRFARPAVRELLPAWWRVTSGGHPRAPFVTPAEAGIQAHAKDASGPGLGARLRGNDG
jgi:Rad3-related DNA helicase